MLRSSLKLAVGAFALFLLDVADLNAQSDQTSETAHVESFHAGISAGKTYACPGNVPVGERAVRFNGTVTTTNPNGISYQVLIRYGAGGDPAGAMEHRDLTTSIGTWSVGMSDAETTLELNVTVTPAQPLDWAAELWGIDPGNVYHIWQTRNNGSLSRDETCEYQIVGVPDLAITIDHSGPYWVDGSFGKGDLSSAEDGGPDPGYFQVPVNAEIDLKIIVVNHGDDAEEYGIGGSMGPLMTGVDQLFEIISVDPSDDSGLVCDLALEGPAFGCDGTFLASGDEVEIIVRYHTVERGIGAFSAGGAADGERAFGDNNAFDEIHVVDYGGILYLKQVRIGNLGGPLGSDPFAPGDGYAVELYDDDGQLVATDTTRAIDIDEDDRIDYRGAIFFKVPEGTYRAKEILGPGVFPVDPPSGEITGIVVEGIDTVVVVQKNEAERDWGDLPDPYLAGTGPDMCPDQCFPTDTPNGASHGVSEHVFLGTGVDPEIAPSPHIAAAGDDLLDGNDDEDGLASFTVSPSGVGRMEIRATLSGVLPGPFELNAWVDFDDDGILERSERVGSTLLPVGASGVITTVFEFPVPRDSWTKYVRIRLGNQIEVPISQPDDAPDVKADGHWFIGEVEDYYTPEHGIDYGDAPEMKDSLRDDIPYGYPTTLRRGGAFHITSLDGVFGAPAGRTDARLGDRVDGEPQAQPSTEADGDDDGNLYDEDGILFGSGFVPVRAFADSRDRRGVRTTYGFPPGARATFIPLANREGKIDAWIDFNRDGDWADPGEQVADSVTVNGGPNYTPITFVVPDTAAIGWTFGRFRFSVTGGLKFEGGADSGEVEDYLLRIIPAFSVTTLADAGPGSLRQNIEEANATDGTDPQYIVYDPSASAGKSDAVIMLQSPLPEITNPIVISGGGELVLDGSGAGTFANGFELSGGSAGIYGTTIQNFSLHGIVMTSSNNAVADNHIHSNDGDGVHVNVYEGNRILSNRITDNGGLGIDLADDGPTANDPGDDDGVPNRPEITSVVRGSTTISGMLSSVPNTDYLIQFYTNESCDESGSGEGTELLATTEISTDLSGIAPIDFELEATLSKGKVVTATATGPLGTSEFSECQAVVRTEDAVAEVAPESFELGQNYPNPFARATTIPFDVPVPSRVRIEILNELGQVVDVPVNAAYMAGSHHVTIHAASYPGGVYFYRMTAGSGIRTGKMIIVR